MSLYTYYYLHLFDLYVFVQLDVFFFLALFPLDSVLVPSVIHPASAESPAFKFAHADPYTAGNNLVSGGGGLNQLKDTGLGPPTDVRALIVSTRFITLAWEKPDLLDSGEAIVGYSVFYKQQGSDR